MTDRGRITRGDVILVDVSDSRGAEIRKVRPCVVLSPDELNQFSPIRIVAPMTTGAHPYRLRVPCKFDDKSGHVVLDQLRSIDVRRVRKRLGVLSASTVQQSLAILREMFAE